MSGRSIRPFIRVAIGAIAAIAMVFGGATAASADTTTVITGHVYLGDSSHSASAGEVLVAATMYGVTTTTTTDANGDYSIAAPTYGSLAALTTKFTYQGTGAFGSGYWPGAPSTSSATSLIVTTPTVSGHDITLPPPADVSGQVLLGQAGTPAPAGEVRVVYQRQNDNDSGWGAESSVLVGANGAWVIPSLPAGNYGIRYDYIGSGDYQDIPYWTTATVVPIVVWGAPVIRPAVTIYPPYSISGKVTLGSGGPAAGAGDVKVTWSYRASPLDAWVPEPTRFEVTDGSGNYSITGLQAGWFRLTYDWLGSPAGAFASYTMSDINPVLLTTFDTNESGITTALQPLWAASGHVDLDTLGHSATLGQVKVSALAYSGLGLPQTVTSAFTDSTGSYVLTGLPSNGYILSFEYVATDDFYPLWYSGSGVAGQLLSSTLAHPLDIHSNTAVGNVVVGSGAAIGGTVTDTSGNPLAGQTVYAAAYAIGGPGNQLATYNFTTTTKANGGYRFRGLPDGFDYIIDFGGDAGGNFAYEAWNDASDFYLADDILIAAGDLSLHSGIDAELEHPASISGVITVSGQLPGDFDITNDLVAEVLVRDGPTNTWVETGDTTNLTASGAYSFTGLKPDNYRISVFYVGSGPFKELRSGVLLANEGTNLVYSSTMTIKAPTIAELYASLGGAAGQLGAAVSGIGTYANAGGGSLQHFANGTIYASNLTGTHVVWAGPLRESYWALSSIFGPYGWPVGDQDCSTGTCTQWFMGGTITPTVLAISQAPAVTGATMAGATLTASTGTYSPAATSYKYQWMRDGAVIPGATAATYVPTAADVGHTLRVDVTATGPGYLPTLASSSPTAAIGPSAATRIANLYAANSVALGAPASAVVAFTDNGGGSLQHFANGSIYSSNSGTWVVWAGPIRDAYWAASSIFGIYKWPTGPQVCASGSCSQTFTGGTLTAAPLTVSVAPAITGAARVGGTLFANAGSYVPAATSVKYAWIRDDALTVPGATSSTYVPTAADAGHTFQVEVTASKTGSVTTVALSAPSAAIGPSAAMQIASLASANSAALGAATSAVVAFADNGGGSLQHFAGGSIYSSNVSGTWIVWAGPIRDAYWAASSIFGLYKWPSGAQACASGTCSQTFIGGTLSAAPLAVNTAPTISGATQVGATLFANAGSYSPAATAVSYAWLRDTVRVAGATASTFALGAADAGHTFQVEVTASRTGSVSTVTLSAPTAAIGPSAAMQISALYSSLGGTPGQLGTPVSAVVAFPDGGGGSLQHFANGSIYSSNSGTWVVWAGPIRDAYWAANSIFGLYKWPTGAQVCVSGTCSQTFIGGTLSAAPLAVTAAPTISGSARVGGTLIATAGVYSPAATSVKYAWVRDDALRIVGATGATYVPTDADAGHTFQVEVTASKAGAVSTVALSAPSAAIGPSAAMQIATLYAANSAALGAAASAVVAFPDGGGGSLQHYANGSIYSSNVSGTWIVWAGPIRDAYWAASSIFGIYKWPSGVQVCASGTCSQTFIGGTLSASPLTVNTAPSISGTTQVGATLFANAGSYAPAATAVRYGWLRDGVRIAGATSSTYVPVPADATHTLQVEVTASRTGSVSTVALSAATAAITPSAAMQIASLYAANSAQLGAAVSAAVPFPDNGGGTLQHFQHGSIYSSNVSGTWIVPAGAVRDAYWAANSIFGTYKWPSGAQVCSGGTCTQQFTGGAITR